MKTTDFSRYLQKYFLEYMPNTAGNSPRTIDSYRYTFIRFLEFLSQTKGISTENVTLAELNYYTILEFYAWLESTYKNSASTRNQRQAAINSFVRFLSYEYPDYMEEYQRILAIPAKKYLQKEISYVKADGIKCLLSEINQNTPDGYRDYVMISLMFTTGIRVSELISIRARDVQLQEPATLLVHGKGNKVRYVPLVKHILPLLEKYMVLRKLDSPERLDNYLFLSHTKQRFTRQGINYIISKYRDSANNKSPGCIPSDFSPHKVRHSTAMNLLEAEVDLIYIRDLLGHASVQTTEIYAKADSKKRREAIESMSKEYVTKEAAQWEDNTTLREWLKNYGRKGISF